MSACLAKNHFRLANAWNPIWSQIYIWKKLKRKKPVIIQFTKRQEKNGAEQFPDENFSDQENDGDLVTEMADTESNVDSIIPDEFPKGTENNDIRRYSKTV